MIRDFLLLKLFDLLGQLKLSLPGRYVANEIRLLKKWFRNIDIIYKCEDLTNKFQFFILYTEFVLIMFQ